MKQIILLSFPRSGNTFTRYILEQITHFESHGYNTKMDQVSVSDGNKNLDGKILKFHGHVPSDKEQILKKEQETKLLFLIRNPIECFIRHSKPNCYMPIVNDKPHSNVDYFFTNIDIYEKFDGNKKILYYEDMILNFRQYVNNLIEFVGDSKVSIDEFMANEKQHKQNGLKFYNKFQRSYTAGKEMLFHSRNESEEMKELFWSNFKERVSLEESKIFERYYK